ncbi:hypothetical protein AV530_011762 [Patagioenas fasciata monilis]|uniref:Uncharacterized protein n=1 Tax=Patagioenas fasciata monilis TaxID=372326 RepID=A0A1V4KLQ3_PATFA|nr:hypothetical protein AV530_011762 [Patagioenas fasciata monilis]
MEFKKGKKQLNRGRRAALNWNCNRKVENEKDEDSLHNSFSRTAVWNCAETNDPLLLERTKDTSVGNDLSQ